MKLKTITAIATTALLSAAASADSYLYPVAGEAYVGTVPVGIIVNDSLKSALQTAQLGAECAGESTTACMPSLTSVEVASLITTDGTQGWDNFGLPAFPAGAAAQGNTVLVCGRPDADDPSTTAKGATLVATSEVGMGCSGGALPVSKYNSFIGAFVPQANTATCTSITAAYGLNIMSFAAATETLPAGYSFVKFNGSAPSIDNVIAGDYTMIGDVHGDPLSGADYASAGAAPQHKLNLTSTSDVCAPASASSVDIGS
jgi:hypothetical protein